VSIGLRFWRHPDSFGFFEFVPLAIAAVGVAMIWLLNFRHRIVLNRISEHQDVKMSSMLNGLQRSSAFFSYLVVLAMLTYVHRH
jgi:hypothetical protein